MMSDGLLPSVSGGGMRDPRRDEGPLPGAREPLRLPVEISTLGGSTMDGLPPWAP